MEVYNNSICCYFQSVREYFEITATRLEVNPKKKKAGGIHCPYCPSMFLEDRSMLGRHVKAVHLKLKPFGCPICAKRKATW